MNSVSFGFYMFVHVTLSYGLTGGNICGYNDTHFRCCRNYEEKNNKCVECRPGFFGMNCLQTCTENFYGNLCTTKCDCIETQICHHVFGCLHNSTLTNDKGQGSTIDAFKFLIGTGSAISVCLLVGIWILYRMHSQNQIEERRNHHNVVFDLEQSPRIQGNPNDYEEPAEHLYSTCSYEDTCYSALVLRMNNESVLEPRTSRQEIFNDENVHELANSFERQSDER